MIKSDITALQDLLSAPKKIVIVPHRSPDGDAMGSTLGMKHFLTRLGHHATVISPNNFPPNLAWLPGADEVVIYENQIDVASELFAAAGVVVIMDFNAFHRVGEMERELAKVTAPILMIDHHQMPDPCATYTFSDTSYASTCEMLFDFIQFLEKDDVIDSKIATCIYTGMVTDTGSFKFASTTSRTHQIAALLISKGVDNAFVHDALFDNASFNSLHLLGTALNNLRIIAGGRISYTTLSASELTKHHYVKGDTEGIVNYGLSIKGVTFTAIFIEHADENLIKISFRSKGDVDVNQFARDYFEGGGHRNAAGGKSKLNLEQTVARFVEIINSTPI